MILSCPQCNKRFGAHSPNHHCPRCGSRLATEASWKETPPIRTTAFRAGLPPEPPTLISEDTGTKAIVSVVLGVLGLMAWTLSPISLPVPIAGLVLGIKGRRIPYENLAILGIVLSAVGLVLAIFSAALVAYIFLV